MRSGARWVQLRVPPQSHIARRDGDGSRHAVVSNVDWALLVMGLDDDFNLRRLERYLALVYASGIAPIVVLTKADIAAADPGLRDERLAALRQAHPGHGADRGRRRHRSGQRRPLRPRRLRRADAGAARLVGRGQVDPHQHPDRQRGPGHRCGARARQPRHAHDHRALAAPAAGRRLRHRHAGPADARPDIDEATLAASFGDVETLAGQCRFRDCTHGDEPGCAVREGVDPDRLRNFHKLLRETRRDTMTWVERRQQLSAWKSRGKEARVRMKMKRGEAERACRPYGRRPSARLHVARGEDRAHPGSPRAVAATRAAATSAAAIGRTPRGTIQPSGRAKRIASASIAPHRLAERLAVAEQERGPGDRRPRRSRARPRPPRSRP